MEHFLPTYFGFLEAAEFQAAEAGVLGNLAAEFGFVGHLAGVVDEVTFVFAEEAGFAVLDHLLPTASVVHDEDAAAGHGFKAHAGPVLRGVTGLEDDLAVLVKVLLADDAAVAGGGDPGVRAADLGLAAGIKAEEEAPLHHRSHEVLVDVQGVGSVFIRVLAGDAPAAEVVFRPVFDEREGRGVKVGREGEVLDLGIGVQGLQQRHVLLPHPVILVEEEGDQALCHALLLLVEEPGHAVDEDRPPRAGVNIRQVLQELRVAKAHHHIVWLNGFPFIARVNDHAALQQLGIQWFLRRVVIRRDKMHVDPHH